MDFLDPRKKTSRRSKLLASYIMMALLVTAAAVILLGSSFGYGVNTKTGEIVQNGLVFVDSVPIKANISINGKDTGKSTSAHSLFPGAVRLVLPAGSYKLNLEQAGYRTWSDSFKLPTQAVLRFDYPVLFPVKLSPRLLDTYKTKPIFFQQTPDHRWILAAFTDSSGKITFKEYDANNPRAPVVSFNLSNIAGFASSDWRPLMWSDDGSSLLLGHYGSGATEFIVLDRSTPANSYNLSTAVGSAVDKSQMRNGKDDFFYVYQSKNGKLYSFDVNAKKLSLLASNVQDFAGRQNQLIYVTPTGAPNGYVLVKLLDGSSTYTLDKLKTAHGYLLAVSSYQGTSYYAVGSSVQPIKIFKNPLDRLRAASEISPSSFATLKQSGTNSLILSPEGRFLSAQSGRSFFVYDLERKISYSYRISSVADSPAVWSDEYHLSGRDGSKKSLFWDYDGANQQQLLASEISQGALFDQSYKTMFSLSPGQKGTYILMTTALRL